MAKEEQPSGFKDLLNSMMKRRWYISAMVLGGFMIIIGGIFGAAIYPDAMDSNTNILYIGQGGLSLPDESYYREDQFASIRTAFIDHVTKMCALVGIADSADVATRILALETEIADLPIFVGNPSFNFSQVSPPSIDLYIAQPSPPLFTTQGKRRCSHMVAYKILGFVISILKSAQPVFSLI